MEKIKRQMLASITGEVEGIIRVWPVNVPNGKNWVVTRNTFHGTHHLGYFATESEANESAEQERTEAKRSAGAGARWWVENPPQLIQSTSLGKLDSLGRARALKAQLAAIDADPLTAPRMPAAAIVAAIVRKYRLESSPTDTA